MTTIVFNTENYDFKKEYNNSTGIFTAKSNGLYTIKASATAGTTASISNEYMSMQIYKNSSDVLEQQSSILDCTATGIYPMYQSVSVKKTVYLERNDTIAIRLHAPYSGAGINANVTYLSIIQEDYI